MWPTPSCAAGKTWTTSIGAGRFVTVLPRSRLEDGEFRKWIQTHEPEWEKVWDRPNPRRKGGPRDRWYVCRAPLPSREAWPVTWVFSTLLALRQEQSRREQLAGAQEELSDLKERLRSPKSRPRNNIYKYTCTRIIEAC